MRGISSLFLGLFCALAQAQDVPNNSFENGSGVSFSSWISNENIYGITDTIWTTRDTLSRTDGLFSAVLTSDTFLATSNESAAVPGSLILGAFRHVIGNPNATISPIAYHHRPDTLYFDYKYIPNNSDSASFQFIFSNADSILLNLSGTLSAQPSWKTDTIILTSLYNSPTLKPDSLFAQFRSSANASTAQIGSRLWIDNIRLRIDSANTPSAITPIADDRVAVYPNPASNILFVEIEESFPNSVVELFDLQGRLLLTQKAKTGKNTLKTADLESGIYFVSIRLSEAISVCKRILITH